MVWIERCLQDHPVPAPLLGTGASSTGIHFWILQVALTSGGVFLINLDTLVTLVRTNFKVQFGTWGQEKMC